MKVTDRAALGTFRAQQSTGGAVDAVLTRMVDVGISVLALAFLGPLLLLVAVLVVATNPGPVFFAHRRIGYKGQSFPCFKFRTMVVDAEQQLEELLAICPLAQAEWALDHKLRNDPRITRIGAFLRRSSIDELPQLFNVLRGEMSIVGPRPIVVAEIVRYGRHFADYCRTRPGITGLWQINGRNDVSYRRRVALDATYARTRSVAGDVRIIALTFPAVLAARGSY